MGNVGELFWRILRREEKMATVTFTHNSKGMETLIVYTMPLVQG